MSDDNVTQIMPDHPELIALSEEAKRFRSSDFGSYLLDKAAFEAGEAARELTTVDPADTKRIMKLQNDARRLTDLNRWINEAIQIGDAEYAEYQRKVNEGE